MASAFATLLVGAAVLLIFWLFKTYTYWWRRGIPFAKGTLPFVGHMLPVFIARKCMSEVIRDIYDNHKDCSMVGIYKGVKPILIIREPGLIKTVLQSSFSSFHENGAKIHADLDPLAANNPFFTSGEIWVAGRKRLTYAFTNMRLKNLFVAVTGVCKKFNEYLDRRLSSSGKYEVELKQLFSKFTGEVVANAGFGIEGLCFEDKTYPEAFDQIGHVLFPEATLGGLSIVLAIFFPEINNLLRIRFIPKSVDAYFRRIVAENLETRRKETTPRNDFLQLMIELEKVEGKVDPDIIASHAMSFFFDGYETSGVTLSFVGYQLAVHQDVQEKLRSEINDVLARHGGELTFESLKEMTYMDQVIQESQRHYPALGFLNKVCTEEIELKGSDGISHRMKRGDEVLISLAGIQKDPKYWDNTETYDPDRFEEERKKSIEKTTFLPFGEGPRICVGMRMAMMQMKSCLATLLRGYKLELSPKTIIPIKLSPSQFQSTPIGGFWIHVSKL